MESMDVCLNSGTPDMVQRKSIIFLEAGLTIKHFFRNKELNGELICTEHAGYFEPSPEQWESVSPIPNASAYSTHGTTFFPGRAPMTSYIHF